MKFLHWFTFCLGLCLAACGPADDTRQTSDPITANNSATTRTDEDALTFLQAKARKARIGEIHYQLFFDLASSPDLFKGRALVNFELSSADAALTIDFANAQLDRVLVNGHEVDTQYNGFFITIPADVLLVGSNKLEVEYQHPYSIDGTGLHHFTDPEDGLTYVYTYLWPYYANRLFPAFDQPNLKATFDLQVKAPEEWVVVSTAAGEISESNGSVSTWTFATTAKMSTYVFSLHAGPYKIWEDKAGEIPIRLFARQSLARYVAVDEWLKLPVAALIFMPAISILFTPLENMIS